MHSLHIKAIDCFHFTHILHLKHFKLDFKVLYTIRFAKEMARAIIFVLCLVVASSLAGNQNTDVNVAIVDDLDEYLLQHPEVKLLQKLDKIVAPKSESPLLLITYRLGNRIAGKFEAVTIYKAI